MPIDVGESERHPAVFVVGPQQFWYRRLRRQARDYHRFAAVYIGCIRVGVLAYRLDEYPTPILDSQSRREAGREASRLSHRLYDATADSFFNRVPDPLRKSFPIDADTRSRGRARERRLS
jgi:hypothetical protein